LLVALYGEESGRQTHALLSQMVEHYTSSIISRPEVDDLTERDSILITYGDQVLQPGQRPLLALSEFCQSYLMDVVSGIHLLPFFPSSSDDGFAVVDYWQVDPELGDWNAVGHIGKHFRLMFDAVVNHVSAQSEWFLGFRKDQSPYKDYFITVEEGTDLSQVVRPRTLPLLTPFATPSGKRFVWTTFSSDQVDLNYENPKVLLEIIELILFYAQQGAHFIRLDAIAYLWKQVGTSCIHLPNTHRVVKLMRAVLDLAAPQVYLITETNVPHTENISYFGENGDEAQMVYNFALPPLVLHTFHSEDAREISSWAKSLALPSKNVTYFNFLASHDGIGVTPLKGLVSPLEIEIMVRKALDHGGLVSYRTNPDGSQTPYELNINFFDALSNPEGDEPVRLQIDRFLAAHALMFALVGIPGIYFHSLFGSRGWREGVELTGRNRTINRQKLDLGTLKAELGDPDSLRSMVFNRLAKLLRARAGHPAFHPQAAMQVLDINPGIFALLRHPPDGDSDVLCLLNITHREISFPIPQEGFVAGRLDWRDIVEGERYQVGQPFTILLKPYQPLWLAMEKNHSSG